MGNCDECKNRKIPIHRTWLKSDARECTQGRPAICRYSFPPWICITRHTQTRLDSATANAGQQTHRFLLLEFCHCLSCRHFVWCVPQHLPQPHAIPIRTNRRFVTWTHFALIYFIYRSYALWCNLLIETHTNTTARKMRQSMPIAIHVRRMQPSPSPTILIIDCI